ncbi:hypothetical protein NADFUDRAFT_81233, partial [Nadsonia fulvescens var. elongata DSM 6958]
MSLGNFALENESILTGDASILANRLFSNPFLISKYVSLFVFLGIKNRLVLLLNLLKLVCNIDFPSVARSSLGTYFLNRVWLTTFGIGSLKFLSLVTCINFETKVW